MGRLEGELVQLAVDVDHWERATLLIDDLRYIIEKHAEDGGLSVYAAELATKSNVDTESRAKNASLRFWEAHDRIVYLVEGMDSDDFTEVLARWYGVTGEAIVSFHPGQALKQWLTRNVKEIPHKYRNLVRDGIGVKALPLRSHTPEEPF